MPNKRVVKLTVADLTALIGEVQLNIDALKAKNSEFVQRMTTMGAELTREEIIALDKVGWTGDLYDSVTSRYDAGSNTGYVEVTSDHAKFVEYGTGVVGFGTHPDPPMGLPQPNPHPNGEWLYENPVGTGWWHRTSGQPAAPFFYNARNRLEDEKLRVAKEVFKV